jgi:hypothetical protein
MILMTVWWSQRLGTAWGEQMSCTEILCGEIKYVETKLGISQGRVSD